MDLWFLNFLYFAKKILSKTNFAAFGLLFKYPLLSELNWVLPYSK